MIGVQGRGCAVPGTIYASRQPEQKGGSQRCHKVTEQDPRARGPRRDGAPESTNKDKAQESTRRTSRERAFFRDWVEAWDSDERHRDAAWEVAAVGAEDDRDSATDAEPSLRTGRSLPPYHWRIDGFFIACRGRKSHRTGRGRGPCASSHRETIFLPGQAAPAEGDTLIDGI